MFNILNNIYINKLNVSVYVNELILFFYSFIQYVYITDILTLTLVLDE